jgi:MFS family permease
VSRGDLLRQPALLALLAREFISLAGSQMTFVALPWFVLTTTGSATRMAVVLAVEAAALAIVGFLGGNVATRLGPRRTMLIADGARAPIIALIPVLHLADALSFPLLLVLVAAHGALMGPAFASKQTILPELVGEDEARVAETNALLQTANRLALILGPPLAGALIGVVGAVNVLWIDAATFLVAFILIAAWVRTTAAPAPPDEVGGLTAGMRFLMRDRLLRPWTLYFVIADVTWLALFAALPVLVIERFGAQPEILGWLFGGFGVGAVVGSAVAFRFIGGIDRLLAASVGEIGMVLPLWLLLLPLPAAAAVAVMAFAGLFNGFVNAPLHTLFLLRIPTALRAKAWLAVGSATQIAAPVGYVAIGPALDHWGVDPALLAICAILSAAVVLFTSAGLRERALRRAEPAVEMPD